ncbi:MAG: hypothetical protein LBS16_08025 [Prevotellaceae bacterium]|jgi:membrane protein implicated in regulation of membrane protease activity|nr:hypothetical protein [Prevotellaceae bacterium]
MQEWWLSLDLFMQTVWVIAIVTSSVFVIQSIMTFAGMDSGSDFSADFSGDMTVDAAGEPFQLFTFRNFINFFLGFSWTIIVFSPTVSSATMLIILAVVVGVALVSAVMGLFVWMSRMQQSGNIPTERTVGCKGTVYLTIPGNRQAEGKVQITVQGAIREFDAITNGDTLANGAQIRVVEVISSNTLLVEPNF